MVRQQQRGLTAYRKGRPFLFQAAPNEHSGSSVRHSGEQDMGGIERRELMKAAAIGGITFSIGDAQSLLASNETRAQEAPSRAAAWSDRRLLDLLKIDHPIIQAPMGFHVSPDMPAAVCGSGGLGSFPCAPLTPAQLRDV